MSDKIEIKNGHSWELRKYCADDTYKRHTKQIPNTKTSKDEQHRPQQ